MRIALLLPILLCGCGTVRNLDDTATIQPFGGVAQSAKMARGEGHMGLFLMPLGVLDMPLSLVGDVVMLPYTAASASRRRSEGGEYAPPTPELLKK